MPLEDCAVHVVIRRALEEDWQTFRDVRLAALQDSPSAFGSTYAKEAAWPEEEWRKWAAKTEKGDENIMFLGFAGDRCVGVAGGFVHDKDTVMIISMWVAPDARRQGIGRLLVASVVDWARSVGSEFVDLWVTEGNDAARRLYEEMGFTATDDGRPLPSDESHRLRRMVLRLAANT